MSSFQQLGLSEETLKALDKLGFETPSEIQSKSIPTLLNASDDFIGLAQTGTGKTAAFGLPLIELIKPEENYPQALVLSPTRELGQQIAEQLKLFSQFKPGIKTVAIYGGASITEQIKAVKRGAHIIIATPGRLLDLMRRKSVSLHQIEYVVLDEADEMLNMGFKEELDGILSQTPEFKLTWLFSATMPPEIRRIVSKYMMNPKQVSVQQQDKVNTNITHQYALVHPKDRAEALIRLLDVNPELRGVVFCRTRRDTQELADVLLAKNYRADALHGDLSQAQRDKVMKKFKDKQLQVLIATDVAARGIDVDDLSHVFHLSLPDDSSYYTHRSGRTARAGKTGISYAFVGNREERRIRDLEKNLQISFSKEKIPTIDEITASKVEKWCQEVLNSGSKKGIDDSLFDYAQMLFSGLSKDELLAKLLAYELERITHSSGKDLNDTGGFRKAEKEKRRRFKEKKGGYQKKSRFGFKKKR